MYELIWWFSWCFKKTSQLQSWSSNVGAPTINHVESGWFLWNNMKQRFFRTCLVSSRWTLGSCSVGPCHFVFPQRHSCFIVISSVLAGASPFWLFIWALTDFPFLQTFEGKGFFIQGKCTSSLPRSVPHCKCSMKCCSIEVFLRPKLGWNQKGICLVGGLLVALVTLGVGVGLGLKPPSLRHVHWPNLFCGCQNWTWQVLARPWWLFSGERGKCSQV